MFIFLEQGKESKNKTLLLSFNVYQGLLINYLLRNFAIDVYCHIISTVKHKNIHFIE